jgi:molecular chaperone DnaK
VLVGGPTLAPYFREKLNSGLGIALDYSVDPLPVVARGAAIFAGTQRLSNGKRADVQAGQFAIDFKYPPVGVDSEPTVGGKVSGSIETDFTGFSVELVNAKTKWSSGKIALRKDGVFITTLRAERGTLDNHLTAQPDFLGCSWPIISSTSRFDVSCRACSIAASPSIP